MTVNADTPLAWFWCTPTASLFVGLVGAVYPDSDEVARVGVMSTEEAMHVFTQHVSPYAEAVIPAGKISTLYCHEIFHP